jgi:hypothetical protein
MAPQTLADRVRERLERGAARRRVRHAAGRLLRWAALAGVVYALAGFFSLELSLRQTTPAPVPETFFPDSGSTVVSGVFSVHSGRSHDAFGSFEAIADAARRADLDFVYLSDHPADERRPNLPEVETSWIDSVLVVPGQELVANDLGRVLAIGLDTTFRGWTDGEASFKRLFEERHATAFVIHGRSPRAGERWSSGSVDGMAGWEALDLSETAKRRVTEPWALYHVGTLLLGMPLGLGDVALLHLTRDGFDIPSVAAFDSLRMKGPLTATAGINHHPKWSLRGRPFPPYGPFLRTFQNHVTLGAPLPDDPAAAEAAITEAVRAGRVIISLGDGIWARAFRFEARTPNARVAGVGDRAAVAKGTVLRAAFRVPPRERLAYRVMRNGQEVAFLRGSELDWRVPGPGIYRLEVYRFGTRVGSLFMGLRPWIFTNPIELLDETTAGPDTVDASPEGDSVPPDPGPGR